jgi:c-di-GMP-binding flagellar brake protein YcgR
MDPNELEDLDFELEPGTSSPEEPRDADARAFIRKSFRVPIEETGKIRVKVDDHEYTVINLSRGGVGFLIGSPKYFSRNDILSSVTLKIAEKSLTLKGRVTHVSPHESGECLCGMEFQEMDAETEQEIADILEKEQSKLFGAR